MKILKNKKVESVNIYAVIDAKFGCCIEVDTIKIVLEQEILAS